MKGVRRALTDDEVEVVNLLAESWNKFLALPRAHPDELNEYRSKIHDLQRLVICRPHGSAEGDGK